ncbi:MAG: MmcQ/YjbR family DNA-binding protein [Chloroflexota bacterium]|nr:MmcQ/YjbR family DNA-binding protein [Chloroflexota bacterium]
MAEKSRTEGSEVRSRVREFALSLPAAYEDRPWGERVVKVNKKVFVFLGIDGAAEPGIGLKLVTSHPMALAQPGVTPMGHGLGRAGWVWVLLGDATPFEMLRDWAVESYLAVAPRRLAAQLDLSAR